jgi:hypothetical protein
MSGVEGLNLQVQCMNPRVQGQKGPVQSVMDTVLSPEN